MTIEQLDATCMGSTTTVHEPGLKGFSAEVEFLSDFTDDEDDEDLYALWNARTKFAVILRPSATSVGAANPNYTFTGFIGNWASLAGSIGQLAGGTLTLANSSALTRATS
jgi:hypothetical protein